MNNFLKNSLMTVTAAGSLCAIAAPAGAAVLIDKIQIKNAQSTWLQVAEVQVFSGPTAISGLAASSATGVYSSPLNDPAKAVDGDTNGDYYGTNSIYHGGDSSGGDVLTIDFALTNVSAIKFFGRTDHGYGFRDTYTYSLFSGGNLVQTGVVDARSGSATLALPELSTWAMMLGGFSMIGFGIRRRRQPSLAIVHA